ncbi:MAG: helix-turn-helix transcriptional regulator [Mediterraneibacter faecis]|jgi:AraC-like DNA-binding protein
MRDLYLNATSNQLESVFDNSKAAYSFLLDLTSYALYHPKLTSPRVTLAKNYIDTHFYNVSLNLDEISDAVGLSKYHLCREFTHLYGTSPGKYLTNLRIQKSCILLLQNRYHTIGDIASMVGFSNDNYFCKVFRKSLGITPTQYRIQNQNYDLVRVLHDSHPCVPSDK